MHLALAGGRLWRKLMSVCEHKGGTCGTHHPLFSFRGPCFWSVSRNMSVEKRFRRCVDPCQRCLTLDDTHDLCVMCLGEEHARSVLEGKKLRSRLSRFLERIGAIICPPRLGSSRCWGSEETEFAAIADEACERVVRERNFSSRARQRLTRVNCGRKMYCLLHLPIQQKVLYWLMVCFPRCRAAGGYEACASAR